MTITTRNLAQAAGIAAAAAGAIAILRTGVLARWAAVLLSVATVSTAALAVLPEAFNRPLAVPEGVALIGLGTSLWRDQRNPAHVPAVQPTRAETAAVR